MDRFTWYLRQLVPHTLWTVYRDDAGAQHFSIWKMWLGRCYDVTDVVDLHVAPCRGGDFCGSDAHCPPRS